MILVINGTPHLLNGQPFTGQVLDQALGDRFVILNVVPPCFKFIQIRGADPFLDQGPEVWKLSSDKMTSDGTEHMPPTVECTEFGYTPHIAFTCA